MISPRFPQAQYLPVRPRFLGVEVPLLLQSSIALFTGVVAATLFPPVRRAIPRPIEIAMWVMLVVVCVIGVLSITNPHARELTASAFWGVDQTITTLGGMLGAGVTAWLVDNRFTIATFLTLVCGADVVALALLRSHKKSRGWQPRIRLYEWVELPRLTPASEPVAVPYAIDELNRQCEAAMAFMGTALLNWSVDFSIWAKDVLLPQLATWLGQAAAAVRTELTPRPAVDIHVLPNGWYDPMRLVHEEEEDEDESQQTGRLAS